MSWEQYAIRGIVALAIFAALFVLAALRWRDRKKDNSEDDSTDDPGLD